MNNKVAHKINPLHVYCRLRDIGFNKCLARFLIIPYDKLWKSLTKEYKMENKKKWYQSKTIIGGLVAMLGIILKAFGFEITLNDQMSLIDVVAEIGSYGGIIFAIYGRVKATKEIVK